MAKHDLLFKRLENLKYNINDEELEEICDKIEVMEDGAQFVPSLLALLEENPHFDFGTPGVIVSTLEKFHGKGYEEHLIESLNRKPTSHLVWMLNRLINGAQGEKQRAYLRLMKKISVSSMVDSDVQNRAKFYLE